MIVKILGILDILAAIIFWIYSFFGFIPEVIVVLAGLYLLIKGIVFLISMDIASLLDVLAGLTILISTTVTLPEIITVIVSLFIIQKGIFSLF